MHTTIVIKLCFKIDHSGFRERRTPHSSATTTIQCIGRSPCCQGCTSTLLHEGRFQWETMDSLFLIGCVCNPMSTRETLEILAKYSSCVYEGGRPYPSMDGRRSHPLSGYAISSATCCHHFAKKIPVKVHFEYFSRILMK